MKIKSLLLAIVSLIYFGALPAQNYGNQIFKYENDETQKGQVLNSNGIKISPLSPLNHLEKTVLLRDDFESTSNLWNETVNSWVLINADRNKQNNEETAKVAESAITINQSIGGISKMAISMSEVISLSSLSTFIQTVKLDHLVWKIEVYKALRGDSTKTECDFADHTQCRLGKWFYEGEGKSLYSQFSEYQKLEKPHQEVHESGKLALQAKANGDSLQMINMLNRMESASMGVFEHLNGIEGRVKNKP